MRIYPTHPYTPASFSFILHFSTLNSQLSTLNSQLSIMKTITYTRRSLACQYFPDAEPEQAVRRLTSWIRRCRPLYAELTRDGTPFDKRRNLTVREARLIMEYLGEP